MALALQNEIKESMTVLATTTFVVLEILWAWGVKKWSS
jgi:hypothetical protein